MGKKLPLCAHCGESLTEGNEESLTAGGTPRLLFIGPDPKNPKATIRLGWHGTCAAEDSEAGGANPLLLQDVLAPTPEGRFTRLTVRVEVLAAGWVRMVRCVRNRQGFTDTMIG